MLTSSSSPTRSFYDPPDPYNPAIVDDLLRGANDWRNIQDIVRLTFKALSDTVRAQGQALKEIERQMPSRLTRSEFHSALAQKADFTTVSEQIADLRTSLENRSTFIELQARIDDKVSHSELSYLLSTKASNDDLNTIADAKISANEMKSTVHDIYSRLEFIQAEINRQIQALPNMKDLEELSFEVKGKAGIKDVEDMLKFLDEKQTNAMGKKANRNDVDSAMSRKADLADIKKIMGALETKAEQECVEQVQAALDDKVDRGELNQVIIRDISQKADRREIDALQEFTREIKRDLETRVSDASINIESYFKSLKNETEQIRTSFATSLGNKADVREIDKILTSLHRKAETEHVNDWINSAKKEFSEQINAKNSEIKAQIRDYEERIFEKTTNNEQANKSIDYDLKNIKEQIKALLEDKKIDKDENLKFVKNSISQSKSEILADVQTMSEDIDRIMRTIEEINSVKSSKDELSDIYDQISARLEEKADHSDLEKIVSNAQRDSLNSVQSLKDDFRVKTSRLENEIYSKLDQKVSMAELHTYLSEKVDVSQVNRLIGSKASQDEITTVRREIERVFQELKLRALKDDMEHHILTTKNALEEVGKDMLLKASIKDICTLLDMKASVEDVNQALMDIHKELDTKANHQEVIEHMNEQSLINEALCSENTVGRWIWKSSEVKNGFAIPWEIQSVNTCPENFLWEPEGTNLIVVAPGLYEVMFGFYSKKKPTVQLLVNGEPILSAVNNASYVIHHSSGRLKGVNSHGSGNITGLTLIDFLALPARSRLSISYTGDSNAEGFFGLRKL